MKKRFTKGSIYTLEDGPYDDNNKKYDCVMPVYDDNGEFYVVDCWITDKKGNVHPGYNVSPVPILVEDFGKKI